MTSSGPIDALWGQLAPHIEWPEGFSLVFLFAGHPGPVGELRGRVEQSVQQRGKSLKVLDPASVEEVEALVPIVIAAPGAECGAIWISLLRRAGDPNWTSAIRGLMQRLNERRFLLERDVRVPVVIVLSLELRSQVYVLAPDLWAVRSFAEQVPAPEVEAPTGMSIDNRGANFGEQVVLRGDATLAGEVALVDSLRRVEIEWARLLATSDLRRVAVADGFAAYVAALDRGDLRAARRIAMETLAVVLSRGGVEVERPDDFDVTGKLERADLREPRDLRDLSISLVVLGEVEVQAGDLAAARDLFRRSLQLCEALAKADPHNAQASFDLVKSHESLAWLAGKQGDRAAAREHLERASTILAAMDAQGQIRGFAEREQLIEALAQRLR